MMKVTIFQTDIRWADPQENVRQAQQMLTDNPGSDLYVLPEMWATGFATKPQDIAEEENASVALRWMRQATQEHDCAICGSLAVRTQDGRYWNRQYFVTPNDVTTYDKHHLFTYGHEDRYISAGDRGCEGIEGVATHEQSYDCGDVTDDGNCRVFRFGI